jgi:hypothetical protein
MIMGQYFSLQPDGSVIVSGSNHEASFYIQWDNNAKIINHNLTFKQSSPPSSGDRTPGPLGGCAKRKKSVNLDRMLRYLRGAVGIAKADMGVDAADPDVVARRKVICLACKPHYDFGTCNKCTCWLAKKIVVKSEKCPIGKW